jgi:hypothetical protein
MIHLDRPPHDDWIKPRYKAARLVKHAAPIHPGTGTDQSVHGRGGGGVATKPRPHSTNITFVDNQPNPDPELNAWVEGLAYSAASDFEQAYPGTLPEDLLIVFQPTGPQDEMGASAWVDPYKDPSAININMEEFLDYEGPRDLLEQGIPEFGVAVRIALEHDGSLMEKIEVYRQAVIFHELAHVAGGQLGMFPHNWPSLLPQYSPLWYPEPITGKDPSLPSFYATIHPGEFFAEALSDVWHRGDDAAPHSQLTAQLFMGLVEEGVMG